MKSRILAIVLAGAMAAACTHTVAARTAEPENEPTRTRAGDDGGRVSNAAGVIRGFDAMPEGPPAGRVENAAAVVVILDLAKAGFGIGGKHGNGVLSVKQRDQTWSEPVFVEITGGSIGWPAGVTAIDLVLILMEDGSIAQVLDGEFTLGGQVHVAIGPVGRHGGARGDADFGAQVYSYSRSEGVFAGISIQGSQLSIDHDAMARVYGAQIKPHDVVRKAPEDGTPAAELASALRDLSLPRDATGASSGSTGSR